MNNRQIEIIKLLKEKNNFMTSKEIANILQVSTRTIMTDIEKLNQHFSNEVILSSKLGYKVSRHDVELSTLSVKDETISKEQRFFHIIRELLLHKEEVNLYDIADELFISESLLKKDLVQMNKSFKSFDIKLVTHDNLISIVGTEDAKRQLMMQLLQTNDFYKYVTPKQMARCFSKKHVDFLIKILDDLQIRYNFFLNDFSRTNILLHLLIIISRVQQGNVLIENHQTKHLCIDELDQICTDLFEQVEPYLSVSFHLEEKKQIELLIASNSNYSQYFISEYYSDSLHTEISDFVSFLFKEVNQKYYLSLSDTSFLAAFSLHIETLILRMKHHTYIKNPLKKALRNSSPFLYDVAIFILSKINDYFKFNYVLNEDELSFIVIHLGLEIERQKSQLHLVSCLIYISQYLHIQQDVLDKIRETFGAQIAVIELAKELEQVSNTDKDIIISTVDIPVITTQPVIVISPFFTQFDISRIGEAISDLQSKKQMQYFQMNFQNYIHENLFIISHEDINDKQIVIKKLCNNLIDQHFVEPEFIDHVLERESAISTAYINFAIPHSISVEAKKNAISIMIIPDGIMWDDVKVYVVFLIAVSQTNIQELQKFYDGLLSYLLETDIISRLGKCASFEQFKIEFMYQQ